MRPDAATGAGPWVPVAEQVRRCLRIDGGDRAEALRGDALLVEVTSGSADSRDLARACAARLQARGDGTATPTWPDARGGVVDGPQPLMGPFRSDVEELAGVREGDPTHGGGRVDLITGQVWPQAVYDDSARMRATKKTRQPARGGCGSPRSAHDRATATWKSSSRQSAKPLRRGTRRWRGTGRRGRRPRRRSSPPRHPRPPAGRSSKRRPRRHHRRRPPRGPTGGPSPRRRSG